jgi:amidohydrolase
MQSIAGLCRKVEQDVITMRRALHQIPEASFHEKKTWAAVSSYLKKAGIRFESRVGGLGVVGWIQGGGARSKSSQARTVALRTDMDALNLVEQTGLPFASRHRGFMHACGHDAHMAMVLGAGMVLKGLGKDLPGNVKLIFQPAEETPPGGALGMIKAGVLTCPPVDAIIGVHVDPVVPSGKVAVNAGVISAVADDFNITITGRSGHGSSPHVTVDAIVVAAHFITALQTIVSRRVSALDNVVVTVGKIAGGERHNIIAGTVELEGTIRTKKESTRRKVTAMVKQVLDATCAAFGAQGEFEYVKGYPGVHCDEHFSQEVRAACSEILGRSRVVRTAGFEMGGEDFAYYAEKVPGTIVSVGVGNKKQGKIHRLHHPKFDIDEAALKVGVCALAYSAYHHLNRDTPHLKPGMDPIDRSPDEVG